MQRSEVVEKIRDRQSDIQIQALHYRNSINQINAVLAKIRQEKCELTNKITQAKANLQIQQDSQKLQQAKIEMSQGQVELLQEEVQTLKELLDSKKEEGETLYTDIRDHLSV